MWPVRHLYVHVPFCAHRCGYCDFVTVTGHEDVHAAYVAALLAEVEAHRGVLEDRLETVYIGGGTPTVLQPALLRRLLDGLPHAVERTVECNPETVDDELAALLGEADVRVSLGAQSFQPHLLAVLERRATPERVHDAATRLRAAGVRNLSIDLIHGIPGQDPAMVDDDLDELLGLAPEHCSAYELEAKPGTRFTHVHGAALERQRELLEDHYERIVDRLEAAGYGWYETANFARPGYESHHNRAYWLGRDYLGVGIGAVSTMSGERRTNLPKLGPYLEAIEVGRPAPCHIEHVDSGTRTRERLMLGLRLAEGVPFGAVSAVVDRTALERLERTGVVRVDEGRLVLDRRGRMVADDVVARLLQ
jgi:oxygen-independent coproporphyrinogen III oxidase